MELAPLIPLRPPQMVLRLARTELPEVLRRLGHHICKELELDAPQLLACCCVSLRRPRQVGTDVLVGWSVEEGCGVERVEWEGVDIT